MCTRTMWYVDDWSTKKMLMLHSYAPQSLARRCLLPDRQARPTTKELVRELRAMLAT